MAKNISIHLRRFGLDDDHPNTVMALFNSDAADTIHGHLSEQLVKDGRLPVQSIAKLYEIISTFLICSQFCLSTHSSYDRFLHDFEKKEKIILTPLC